MATMRNFEFASDKRNVYKMSLIKESLIKILIVTIYL
jgi:hypothetical protein